MILIDLKYPEKCMDCKLYKCGGCVAVDNKKVPDDIWNHKKPDWCPIAADICKSLSNSINRSLLYGTKIEIIRDSILKNLDKVKPYQGADDSKDRYRYMQWMSCRENIIEYFKKIKEENKNDN